MSKKNGDKARFGKEQKKKLLRRQRNLALRQSLTSNATEQAQASESTTPADSLPTTITKGATDAIL